MLATEVGKLSQKLSNISALVMRWPRKLDKKILVAEKPTRSPQKGIRTNMDGAATVKDHVDV